jgi:hypothetical protein
LVNKYASGDLLYILYYCAGWGYTVAFTKVLISTISYLNSPPTPFSFISHPPIPGIVSTDIFPFTYIGLPYLHHTRPPPFPHLLLPATDTTSPPLARTCSALLFFDVVEEKKKKEKKKMMMKMKKKTKMKKKKKTFLFF